MGQLENNQQSHQVWSRRGFLTAATALASASTSRISGPADVDSGSPYLSGPLRRKRRCRLRALARSHALATLQSPTLSGCHRFAQIMPVRWLRSLGRPTGKGRRLAIKSGGHNVSEVFLRDGGLLLDLGELAGSAS